MKTVSLSLAKQLKENGYPQDTYFHWQRGEEPFSNTWITIHTDFKEDSSLFAAPTTDEILDRLPKFINIKETLWCLMIETHYSPVLSARYGNEIAITGVDTESLPDVLAKMWLYLKKENLLPTK